MIGNKFNKPTSNIVSNFCYAEIF